MLEDPSYEKREAFNAARELLSRNDDDVLRYVALELRRCIEAVVYEKLWGSHDWIPVDAARTWQPPQSFKALLVMEPDADKSGSVAVGLQKEPGVPSAGPFQQLGVDHRPKLAWLTKTWNKLGSNLHARWPFAQSKKQGDPRQFFEGVVAELEPFVSRTLTVTLAVLMEFPCSVCGNVVKVGEKGLEGTPEATCLNCGCRFLARKDAKGFTFYLNEPSHECETCHEQIFVPTRDMKIGHTFSCRNCNADFEVVEQTWGVRKVIDKGDEIEAAKVSQGP